jgi:hypothetical protein
VVAACLGALLARPEERRALADAGLRFAAAHQFHDLAQTLISLVTC